ncbi:MAG TPA: aspartate aminotransferase family protein [Bryobacteraceae bacterium]|nr:aspartate aminotransferase family protein [Bryobacteraceae bacterium]
MSAMTAAITSEFSTASYTSHVNPQWAKLLDLLEMNVQYDRCEGIELHVEDGRTILDFLSGYGVHNAGHNHPRIIAALQKELEHRGPAMLQSHVPDSAGELAARLSKLAGGELNKVFFCSSGSEGVEAAIKFSRARTGRIGLLSARGAFHGLTCGAMSLMSDPFWSKGFGPMLPAAEQVPFGDVTSLETALATKKFAAFIVEPVQGEAGVILPPAGYLEKAQALCRRYGSLLVADEVQTGMFRTGRFLASHSFNIEPDIVVLAKALSGGLVPVGAVVMTDAVYDAVYGSLKRSIVHTSTFSENGLAMRAGLATLDVLEEEKLGDRAVEMGEYLRSSLRASLADCDVVKEVRGIGLMNGIEFQAPGRLDLRLYFETFQKIHPAAFGQMLVRRMFREAHILTQISGNNFVALKASPPLVVTQAQVDQFVEGVTAAAEGLGSSGSLWTEALALARGVINI